MEQTDQACSGGELADGISPALAARLSDLGGARYPEGLRIARCAGRPASTYGVTDAIRLERDAANRLGLIDNQLVIVANPATEHAVPCEARIVANGTLAAMRARDWERRQGGTKGSDAPETPADTALVKLSKGNRLALGLSSDVLDAPLLLLAPPCIRIDKRPEIQDFRFISENAVVLGAEDLERLDRSKPYQQIRCDTSKCVLTLPTACFVADPAGRPRGIIKLSRYQRMLLKLQAPWKDEDEALARWALEQAETGDGVSPANAKALESWFGGGFERDEVYAIRTKATSALYRRGCFKLTISPLYESRDAQAATPAKTLEAGVERLAEFYIGSSGMYLRCVRPYNFDEDKGIVRLSEDTMTMLGIEETDKVIVRYGSSAVRVKAFRINTPEFMRQTTFFGPGDTMDDVIGIPAAVRNELGLPGIDQSVYVERDARYLFRKSLNLQFMPVVALLFTVVQTMSAFDTLNMGAVLAAFFISLPFVVYVVLSEKRNEIK